MEYNTFGLSRAVGSFLGVGKVSLRSVLILCFALVNAVTYADICRDSVAQLGSGSESQQEASREEVLAQIAQLFGLVLNDRAPREAVQNLIQKLADREGTAFGEILREVEEMEASPAEKQAKAEERQAIRENERLRLLEGLEPYLYPIGRDDRKVIEDTLIRPGLVYPLITGEVEFRFQGTHRFVVGDEGFLGEGDGKTKRVSFGPGDNFAIGQVPVTQLLYFLAALGEKGETATPSKFKEGVGAVVFRLEDRTYSLKLNHPVEEVDYYDAMAHAARVSKLTGIAYSLPSELQWEFANRAGSESKYHFGTDEAQLAHYEWFRDNAGMQTHDVGQLLPNAFHLYDTHGNVSEWTSSFDGAFSIIRGGCFSSGAKHVHSAHRLLSDPYRRRDYRGFRLMRQSIDSVSPAPYTFTLGEAGSAGKPATGSWNSLRSFFQGFLDRFRRVR
jgi:hypothetical protein